MTNVKDARDWEAISYCDISGRPVPFSKLQKYYQDGIWTGLWVAPEHNDEDVDESGKWSKLRINEPVSIKDPRPFQGDAVAKSGFNPIGTIPLEALVEVAHNGGVGDINAVSFTSGSEDNGL